MVPTPAPNTEKLRVNSSLVCVIVIHTTQHVENHTDSGQDVQHQLGVLQVQAGGGGGDVGPGAL